MAASVASLPNLPSLLIVVLAIPILFTSLLQASLVDDQQALLQIKLSLQALNDSTVSADLADWIGSDGNSAAANLSSNNTSSNPCAWSRVACSSVANSTRVTGLNLSGLSLAGELNGSGPAFSLLSSLFTLDLSQNDLRGSISQAIANCTHLTTLSLARNRLSSISISLSALSSLRSLNLSANNISASLMQAIPGNCNALQSLDVSGNSFTGLSSVPWQACTSLHTLALSQNPALGSALPANLSSLPSLRLLAAAAIKLEGSIPPSLCAGNALQYLNLSDNSFNGSFPLFLTNCSSLLNLDISHNNLTGELPAEVGDLAALEVINLAENHFDGALPAGLGNLTSLQVFMAGSNGFVGSIPSELSACKNLSLLDLDSNSLSGNLPDFLDQMPSLQYLVLHSNQFGGEIPPSLFNASGLKFLDLSSNSISGGVSPQFTNLSSLQFLLLANNQLTGGIPAELASIAGLVFLDLSSNHLGGSIPPSLGELQNLLWLMLAYNELIGSIPQELGNCTSLLWLNLRSNSLTGNLPAELSTMGRDPQRSFDLNAKSINPPKALGECLMIKRWVPENFSPYSFMYDILNTLTCKSLWIDLLTGIPLSFACGQNLGSGGYIQVSDNKLNGSLPASFIGSRTSVLLLSGNLFSGSLPEGLSELPLRHLNASRNLLSGPIPSSIGNMKCLALLDLSFNNLSGLLPPSLTNLSQLSSFNVSYNPWLSGSIPSSGQFSTFPATSFTGDPLLCYDAMVGESNTSFSNGTLPRCSSVVDPTAQEDSQSEISTALRVALLVIGILASAIVVLGSGLGLWVIRRRRALDVLSYNHKLDMEDSSSQSGGICASVRIFREEDEQPASETSLKRLTYADILLATNNFGEENVLGSGGFGVVYRAKLKDGSTVAVKKLMHHGEQGEREFLAEMETLGSIAQENLVPLLGVCVFGAEKLLVYKYLSNGCLDDWLHERDGGAQALTWSRRVKIACNCAKALSYLHHECTPVLIHRDMKASNVLLDEEFNGYLADFGLAREIGEGYTHVSTVVAGTLGYVPPEYCQTWRATTKGDVYSFGVVMLELITGRHPISTFPFPPPAGGGRSRSSSGTDGALLGLNDDGSLVDWVMALMRASKTEQAYDTVVKQTSKGRDRDLLLFMELAQACTQEAPEQRPSMKAVAQALENLVYSVN